MAGGPNEAQREFWNAQQGRNWVVFEDDLDALGAAATALLLEAGAPRAGERVADVGCGGGASTFAIAEAVGASGRVLGIDISAPLVERAEERRRALGLGNVAFELADAQERRFEPGALDLVASRFGMMFFADPLAAFRNIAGGMRPGGRLVFVVWAGPEFNPWFTPPSRVAAAVLGPAEADDPDAPGPMAFRDIDRVLALLAAAGLTQCRGERRSVELHHPGGVTALVRLMPNVGPVARMLREKGASEADVVAIRAALAPELEPFRSADGIRLPAGLNVFRAVRG